MPISVIPQWEYSKADNHHPRHSHYPDDPSFSLGASSAMSFATYHFLL